MGETDVLLDADDPQADLRHRRADVDYLRGIGRHVHGVLDLDLHLGSVRAERADPVGDAARALDNAALEENGSDDHGDTEEKLVVRAERADTEADGMEHREADEGNPPSPAAT